MYLTQIFKPLWAKFSSQKIIVSKFLEIEKSGFLKSLDFPAGLDYAYAESWSL